MPRTASTIAHSARLERLLRKQALATHPELVRLLRRALRTIDAGLDAFGPIPTFDKRAKITLQVALMVRSEKSRLCALDLALRDYTVPALILARSVLEDRWVSWKIDQDSVAAAGLWEGLWTSSFIGIAGEIDAWLAAANVSSAERDLYAERYGNLSEIAHPRSVGLRLEFDVHGMQIRLAPDWERSCAAAPCLTSWWSHTRRLPDRPGSSVLRLPPRPGTVGRAPC
jgi:hypothetical protein